MYSFESEEKRGALHALVIGTFAAAAILFGLSTTNGIPFPLIFQTGAVIFLVAAVYLTFRYSLCIYRYVVEPSGISDADGRELYDLVIISIIGKKMQTVARVALRDIDEVSVVKRGDKAMRKTVKESLCKDKQVFRYANTPVMAEECYISVATEGAVLVIPPDAGMIKILKG